jgi:hypothetical protein
MLLATRGFKLEATNGFLLEATRGLRLLATRGFIELATNGLIEEAIRGFLLEGMNMNLSPDAQLRLDRKSGHNTEAATASSGWSIAPSRETKR